jgi:hypothetical protein
MALTTWNSRKRPGLASRQDCQSLRSKSNRLRRWANSSSNSWCSNKICSRMRTSPCLKT